METNDTNAKADGHGNKDPITGEPGAHPVGVGIGAAAGGVAAGAAAGTLAAGPVGTVIGAAIGAIVGGLGGKAAAEHFDPTVDDGHWKENHGRQPYAAGSTFDSYAPAYRVGAEGRGKYDGHSFDEAEPHLQKDYEGARDATHVDWDRAKHATRAAWDRATDRT